MVCKYSFSRFDRVLIHESCPRYGIPRIGSKTVQQPSDPHRIFAFNILNIFYVCVHLLFKLFIVLVNIMARFLKLPQEVTQLVESFAHGPCELEFVRQYGTKFNAIKVPLGFSDRFFGPKFGECATGFVRHAWRVNKSAYQCLIPHTQVILNHASDFRTYTVAAVHPIGVTVVCGNVTKGDVTGVEIDFATILCAYLFVDVPLPHLPRIGPHGFIGDLADGPLTEAEEDALDAMYELEHQY